MGRENFSYISLNKIVGKTNNRKLVITLIIFCCAYIWPFGAKCQFHGKYSIKIALDRPLPIESSIVKLLDSSGETILQKYWDTLGACRFTGINKGTYRVISRKYKIDTTFSMPMDTVLPQQVEFYMLIEFDLCNFGVRQARKDVRRGSVRLLLAGGIAPIYYWGQVKFENEFNVKYYELGDSGPSRGCLLKYNDVIFAYLDNRYGSTWRYAIRHDVIGVKEYLKTHPVKY